MDTIENRVKQVIADQLGAVAADLKPETRIVEDLGGDSLDQVEIVMALEDEFEIDIPDEEADKITTVQSAIDCVTKHAGASA